MLASDLNNRDFQGATNPDSLLHVEFYMYAPVDKWSTDTQGKVIKRPEMPFIRIMKPGDNTSILDTPVREDHKQRWPDKWLYFQMQQWMITGVSDIPGWKIDDWEELDDEQKRELKFLRFSVVEQIAGASDSQVQKMGMGGMGLRERAKIALRAKMGAETKSAIEQKDKEISELKSHMQRLEQMIMARQELPAPPQVVEPSLGAQQPAEPPKKRGWPKGKPRKPKEETL